MKKYSKKEIEEIENVAKRFKRRNWFRLPTTIKGNKVASRNPLSQVRNFSTITKYAQLKTGRWVYIIYCYPLSALHRIIDGICKWTTEKYCLKVINPKEWKEAFVANSFIPIIPIYVSNVVAMPYIENENLFDILAGQIGRYNFSSKKEMIKTAADAINEMHSKDVVWGELIVNNIIRTEDQKIVICDTETRYYRGSLKEQKVSDWMDFIFSMGGAIMKSNTKKEVESLIKIVLNQIKDKEITQILKRKCCKNRTFLHKLFFFYDIGRLNCSPNLYELIKVQICRS